MISSTAARSGWPSSAATSAARQSASSTTRSGAPPTRITASPLISSISSNPSTRLAERAAIDALEPLGQLQRHRRRAVVAEPLRHRAQRLHQPPRRLVEHQRVAALAQRRDRVGPRLGLRRQKPDKPERIGRQPRDRQRRKQRRRTGHREHRMPGILRRPHQRKARIGEQRRPRIGDQRHRRAAARSCASTGSIRARSLCSWSACAVGPDAVVVEQLRRCPRVLAEDDDRPPPAFRAPGS